MHEIIQAVKKLLILGHFVPLQFTTIQMVGVVKGGEVDCFNKT